MIKGGRFAWMLAYSKQECVKQNFSAINEGFNGIELKFRENVMLTSNVIILFCDKTIRS